MGGLIMYKPRRRNQPNYGRKGPFGPTGCPQCDTLAGMKLKSMGLLLILVFVTVTPRLAHPAGPGLPANQHAELADFDLPLGYMAQRTFAPPLEFPSSVDVGPSDVIVVTDNAGDRVIQVHEDGTLTTYAARRHPTTTLGLLSIMLATFSSWIGLGCCGKSLREDL